MSIICIWFPLQLLHINVLVYAHQMDGAPNFNSTVLLLEPCEV